MSKSCPVCEKPVRFWHSKEIRIIPGTGEEIHFHSYCFQVSSWGKKERQIRMDQIRDFIKNKEEQDF